MDLQDLPHTLPLKRTQRLDMVAMNQLNKRYLMATQFVLLIMVL